MKFWTKKRAAALGLAALLTLSLAACGEKAPSLEEVEQAIEAGTLTMEDALDKGWVDQAWVDDYWEARTVPPRIKSRSTGCRSLPRPCPVSPLLRRIWGMCSCLPL
ncbi:MAG: hypothetical protein ACLRNW_25580 [Neglectibacter sp.]